METFSNEVSKELKYYVYRLIDPRNGETFYVGKGTGNRVFSHASGDLTEDNLSEKMSRIREIKLAGFEVAHVVHRHGMEEDTAFHVEAALIDAYPGITNIMDGHGNQDCGCMHTSEIIRKYKAETVVFKHKSLIINVSRTATESSLYESTRYAWRLSLAKAQDADVILPVINGIIKNVYVADQWLEASTENFPGRDSVQGRYGFVGKEAASELIEYYVGKRLPDDFRKKGASNPIRYSW